ncbi:Linear gramicidin dehydrogenase LgrE [Aeoliella mucimassa]|uniref:Linear gramicidin dehydrogenase LgrE n=2 Tax=Aeoliella mucimassa TaxID=2527972 RepID=A0A518ASQ9_9BACT|nr:Linear gramicidin dehydrogenase LgrE [Aeoliella mucimassa]
MRMPGREDRLAAPVYDELSHLADEITEAISALPPAPHLFVGHSLGGYVAFEVTRRLVDRQLPLPHKLIVAACGAPRGTKPKSPIGQLPDQDFIDEVSNRYDGIPAAVRESPELMAMVLPPLRADIQMIETYEYIAGEPLPVDILALGGTNDPGVAVHRLNAWRELTSRHFAMRLMPGGHFFLHPAPRREATSKAVPPAIAMVLAALPELGDQ